jgi:membrane-associated phospholipid phosphatase
LEYSFRNKDNIITGVFLGILWFTGVCLYFFLGKIDSFHLINDFNSPVLSLFFKYFTSLGDGLFSLLIFLVLLFKRYRLAIDFLVIFLLTGLMVQIGKRFLFPEELRPLGLLGPDLIHLIDGVGIHEHNSFPSGHTATAVASFLFLSVIQARLAIKLLLVLAGLLVGYSRIYLSQHFLNDVLAGIVIGSFGTWFWIYFSNRIEWKHWSKKSLRSLLGG